ALPTLKVDLLQMVAPVMAGDALGLIAEEGGGDFLGDIVPGILDGPGDVHPAREELRAGHGVDLAVGGKQLAHEFVIGAVGGDQLAEEVVEDAASRRGYALMRARDLEPVGKEQGELIGIGRSGKQLVDEKLALVGSCVLEKAVRLLGRGNAAGQVEIDASKELRVGSAWRGLDAIGRHL